MFALRSEFTHRLVMVNEKEGKEIGYGQTSILTVSFLTYYYRSCLNLLDSRQQKAKDFHCKYNQKNQNLN